MINSPAPPPPPARFLGPDPPFWTNATFVSFSFPDFDSPEGSGPMRYRWAIGSSRMAWDVLGWQPFKGSTSVQPVQVGGLMESTWLLKWVGS